MCARAPFDESKLTGESAQMASPIDMQFAPALVAVRRRLGLTQGAYALAAGIDATRLSSIERGRIAAPSEDFIARFSQAVGLSDEERGELIFLARRDRMLREAKRTLPAKAHGLLDASLSAAHVLAEEDLREVERGIRDMVQSKLRLFAIATGRSASDSLPSGKEPPID